MAFLDRLNHKAVYILGISLLVFFYFGYEIGTSDSVEFMPYVQYLVDPSLFKQDVFIQSLATRPWNERYVFAQTVAWITQGNEVSILFLHFLVLLSTVSALWKIGEIFYLPSRYCIVLAISVLVALEGWNLSCSEFYVGIFEASNVALSLQCWAVVYLLKNRWTLVFGLSFISTLMQPQLGSNFLLVCTGLYGINWYKKITDLSIWPVMFFVLGFGYVFFLFLNIRESTSVLSDLGYEKILFAYRSPHHVYFSSFSVKGIALNLMLFGLSIFYYWKIDNKNILGFVLLIFGGTVVYAVSLYFHFPLGMQTWWMRMSIWIRLWGVIAVLKYIDEKEFWGIQPQTKPWLIGFAVLGLVVIRHRFDFYRLDTMVSPSSPEIKVSRWIEKNTPLTSVIVHPFGFTGVNYYGKRSCYVNFKAIPKPKSFVNLWYKRIQMVYRIDTTSRYGGFGLAAEANRNYTKTMGLNLSELKNKGVTHVICDKNLQFSQGRRVYNDQNYCVYALF